VWSAMSDKPGPEDPAFVRASTCSPKPDLAGSRVHALPHRNSHHANTLISLGRPSGANVLNYATLVMMGREP
jgi:hypothetical protein